MKKFELPRERMSQDATRFRVDLDALLTPHNMQWPAGPPADWMLGAPIGNGDFGAVVYGFPEHLSFALSKTNVWQRYPYEGEAAPCGDFTKIREALLKRDEATFSQLIREYEQKNPMPQKNPHLTTCGTFSLRLNPGVNPPACAMGVTLRDGTMRLTYSNRVIRAVASRAYQVLMVEIDRGERQWNISCHPDQIPLEQMPWELFRPTSDENPAMTFEKQGPDYIALQEVGCGESFAVGVRFVGFAESQHTSLPGQLNGIEQKPSAQKVHVFVTMVSSRDTANLVQECQRRLARAEEAGAVAIDAANTEWWNDYWMRGLAAVGDAAVEKWYYRSLYLCGAEIEPGKQSPGLQGVWVNELHPPWNADYHANVNIQAVYWGLPANNRLDLVEPYIRLYDGFANHSRDVAREYYHMRGLRFPMSASIDGHEYLAGPYASFVAEPGSTAWLIQLFWQYYQYTLDRAYLSDVAYPIIRDAARFLTDYMSKDPKTGGWTIAPVPHFEAEMPGISGFGTNSLYANSVFRMALQAAIDAAGVLQVDAEERAEWQERLRLLADLPTEGGIFKEWEDREPRYSGGHSFHLPMTFPGELVSIFHGPKRWLETALRTWQHIRDEKHISGTGGVWCGGQGILELLRIGEVEEAFKRARWADTNSENGFVYQPQIGFIQVDHGPGMCRVLADMMLLSYEGVVHLFPGIPPAMPARFLSLRAPGGFLLSAEKRDATVNYVVVEPTVEGLFQLASPWQESATITDLQTNQVIATSKDELVKAVLLPGQRYLIAPRSFVWADLPLVDFAAV